ncbi:MAG TPA: peptidoglycan DD-metalloendopeptidase family protein [Chitinophagaceae bacterium]|nr:peptidoglycan DD-metalloendopeptidase family protein [Chitinophagaceae bacterium]
MRQDEYWSGYSMHGGGDQVFAYDLVVTGYSNGWSDLLPGKDDKKNENFRIWGKPIYAMDDGEVLKFLNECPNNAAPIHAKDDADYHKKMAEQKENYWGTYEKQGGGGGNHLVIHHGKLVAGYAHMQKGSIPAKFLSKLAKVKKGELLGYAGNSGNSTGPHLHIDVKQYKDNNTPGGEWFRPFLFSNGYVLGKDNYATPKSNVAWSALNKQGIPGLKEKSCFILPGDVHPYCAYPTNWGEVSKFGIPESSFQEEFDKIWTCGYYPIWMDGYDAGGKTYFNVITRPSKGVQWVARHNMDGNKYQDEYNKWDKEGYRLLNINSYLRNNNVNYAAVWVKDGAPQPLAYHGKPLSQHEAEFKGHADKGLAPVNVSCIAIGNNTYVTATWEKKNTGGFYAHPAMTLQQYKDFFKDYTDKQKFKLAYLNAYTSNGVPLLSGIWYRDAPHYNAWSAKHRLSATEFQTEYNVQLANGLLTRCITGYSDGGTQRFEGIWSK